jgi:carboxylesterase type B
LLSNMVLLGLIVSSAVALAQDAKGWKAGQAVKTTSGLVVGHAANTLKGNEQVSEYLGIRYAEPVVGKRRWLAPQPYKGNGTVKADKFV